MAKHVNTAIQLAGDYTWIGGQPVQVFLFDPDGNALWARGATVPTDAGAGAAVGCLFIDTTGGVGVTAYINEGSASSCDFNAAVS